MNQHVCSHYDRQALQANGHRDTLRKCNNWIKRQMIDTAVRLTQSIQPIQSNQAKRRRHSESNGERGKKNATKSDKGEKLRILDLGCGRGGDILKWNKYNVDYTGVDQSGESINEAHRRAIVISMPTKFLHSTIEEYLPQCQELYDVISMQFVLHYMITSASQLEILFQQCARVLSQNGCIIASIVNVDAINELMEEGSTHGQYMSANPIADQDKQSTEIGFMYEFFLHGCVDNCIEFTIPREEIEKAADSAGLQIDSYKKFIEYDIENFNLHPSQYKTVALYDSIRLSHKEKVEE